MTGKLNRSRKDDEDMPLDGSFYRHYFIDFCNFSIKVKAQFLEDILLHRPQRATGTNFLNPENIKYKLNHGGI